jgi:hypothetical protein
MLTDAMERTRFQNSSTSAFFTLQALELRRRITITQNAIMSALDMFWAAPPISRFVSLYPALPLWC